MIPLMIYRLPTPQAEQAWVSRGEMAGPEPTSFCHILANASKKKSTKYKDNSEEFGLTLWE